MSADFYFGGILNLQMNRKPKPWKTLSSKQLFKHGHVIIKEDVVELPNGEHSTYVYTPSFHDSVIIIAINDENKILIQREYSHPPKKIMWQLPGGSIMPQESVLLAAQRELSEESGFAARHKKVIGWYYSNNRNSEKKQHVVLCTGLYERPLQEDRDEFIETFWFSKSEIHDMITANKINNINMLSALNLWFHFTKP